jgi:TonB-linked SusC/RagA family outer membrane protein
MKKSNIKQLFLKTLLYASFLTISAYTVAVAQINLSVKNKPMREVIREIEKTTEYRLFYNDDLPGLDTPISLQVSGASIEEVMKQLSAQSGISYMIRDNHQIVLSASPVARAQQQEGYVRGRITDINGEPIIGANVVLKGTATGVSSDVNGNFSIQAPATSVLVFSYIGYFTQEVAVGNRSELKITLLENALGLDEVVVIGYGVAKKSDLTGAVVRADLSALQNSPNVNLAQGLKGVVPGLNVGVSTSAGTSPSISIRGRNSISGTTSPLIVLDGIIYRGDMIDINPSDIESIDILKDASSAAIYGSQAANGVMLITTKTNPVLSKPVIEYNASVSFQNLIKDMKPMDRDGFIRMVTDSHIDKSRIGADMHINPDYDITADFITKEHIEGFNNGTNVNWFDLMSVDQPYIQNHNVSVRGKNELAAYFVSFGYSDQQNFIRNDTYERYNFRINLDAKVTDWFKVGTQSFFTTSDMSGNNPSFKDIVNMSPLVASHDAEGNIIVLPYTGNTNYLLLLEIPDVDKRYNLTGNFYGELNIPSIKGLTYRLNYSNSLTFNKRFMFNPYSNGLMGSATKNNNSRNAWTLDHILSYANTFGPHALNATLVYGIEKSTYESTNASARNFTNQTLGYNNLAAAQSDQNTLSSSAWEESSLYMMGRLGYTFNNRYIATATIRRDGFSGFGAKHKIGYFPSAALAWRISEEAFLKDNAPFIDNLKLRTSYGINGNRTLGRYATLAHMSTQMPFASMYSAISGGYVFGDGGSPELTQGLATMANEDLRWETTTSFNVGLDFSLLNGRLSGSYEHYRSTTNNLIYNISIPNMNGMFGSGGNLNIATNIGELQNIGHELSLTGLPIHTKVLTWTTTFNYSRNRNKVISILGLDNDGDGREDDLVSAGIFIGQPLGVVYDYNIIGMWQVEDYNNGIIPAGFTYGTYKVEDINGDGKYTAEDDRKILGYTDPSYVFSLQNTLRYKDFELNVFINSVQGGKDGYMGQPLGDYWQGIQLNYYEFDWWTPENPTAKYRQPGAYNASMGSGFSPYMQRSFIRLQELSLAWNIPASVLKKIHFNRARLFVSATNLFTLTDWEGWDAEANMGVSDNVGGYPTMKNYTFGLNFEF